jgi:Carboxypeptidase regulatory-like domain
MQSEIRSRGWIPLFHLVGQEEPVQSMVVRSGTVCFWMRAAALAILLGALGAGTAAAQRVDGQLKDADTSAPIAGATLLLLDEQGQTVHSALSDSRGLFTLRGSGAGVYRIRASRLGYREATSRPIDLVVNQELEVELQLSTDAVRLEPLTVTGIPRYERLEESGFYERRDHFGPDGLKEAVFLEQHDIERLNPFGVSDIFNHVRGVRTDRGGLTMRLGCRPAIVVDGFLSSPGSSRTSRQSILPGRPGRREIASPRSLVGVEVYYGTAIPARYLIDSGGCGVIMFWTK